MLRAKKKKTNIEMELLTIIADDNLYQENLYDSAKLAKQWEDGTEPRAVMEELDQLITSVHEMALEAQILRKEPNDAKAMKLIKRYQTAKKRLRTVTMKAAKYF